MSVFAGARRRALAGGWGFRGEGAQELVGRKKTIHLDCFDIRLDALERKLVAAAEEDRAKARHAADSERNYSGGPYTLRRLIDRIMSLAREVRERHAARPPEDYADEATFKRLVQASRRRGARGRDRTVSVVRTRGASAWPGSGREPIFGSVCWGETTRMRARMHMAICSAPLSAPARVAGNLLLEELKSYSRTLCLRAHTAAGVSMHSMNPLERSGRR